MSAALRFPRYEPHTSHHRSARTAKLCVAHFMVSFTRPESEAAQQFLELLRLVVSSASAACLQTRLCNPAVLAALLLCLCRVEQLDFTASAARDVRHIGLFARRPSMKRTCVMCFERGGPLHSTAFGRRSACTSCFSQYAACFEKPAGRKNKMRRLTDLTPAAATALADRLLQAGYAKILHMMKQAAARAPVTAAERAQ
jgi:hypothetical protein